MRTSFAAGRSEPPGHADDLAHRCAWCKRWGSGDDAVKASNGAAVSHGICPDCKARLLREVA